MGSFEEIPRDGSARLVPKMNKLMKRFSGLFQNSDMEDTLNDIKTTIMVTVVSTLVSLPLGAQAHGLDDKEKNFWQTPEILEDKRLLTNTGLPISDSVIDQFKVWEAGQTLNVCFQSGDIEAKEYFVEIASIWDEVVSTNYYFGETKNYNSCDDEGSFHIRVLLKPNVGNWSYIGTDSTKIDQSKPSLAVSVAKPFALNNMRKLGGTILHEIGHSLAMRHEHQSPESKCEEELDWPRVYTELAQPPNEWEKEKVDRNLRRRMQSVRYKTTEYDRRSIMHYALPSRWFSNGSQSECFIKRNTGLSDMDVQLAKETYPSTPQKQDKYLAGLHSETAVALAENDLTSGEKR